LNALNVGSRAQGGDGRVAAFLMHFGHEFTVKN
jgi:hypothetical protein